MIIIIVVIIIIVISKVGDLSQGWPKGSLFNSYYTKVFLGGATLFPGLLHFTHYPYNADC